MKITSLVLLMLLTIYARAQNNFNSTREYLRQISIDPDTKRNTILTQRGINIFFARKVASYLAGENDLSLYKNYAVADISDGILFLGRNFQPFKRSDNRISDLITLGIKANSKNNFSKLFSSGEFAGEIGIDLKYTHIFPGSILFDKGVHHQIAVSDYVPSPQQRKMNVKRKTNLGKINFQMLTDSLAFYSSLISIETQTEKDELIKEFIEKKDKEFKKKFAELEADEFEADEKSHNASHVSWFSIIGFVPLTNTTYNVANSFSTKFEEKTFKPWEGNLSYTYVRDSKRYGRIFLTVGVGGFLNNSAKNENIDKIDLNTYKQLGGTDTITIAQLSSDEAFIGEYKTFFTGKLKGQMVYFLPNLSWIGLSIQAEQFFGDYKSLNAQLGFPMIFEGKDNDSKVNVEFQLKSTDLNNIVKPDKDFKDKFSIGISVGLPFSSIIY